MQGTWKTTGSSGTGTAALVIGAAILAAAVAGPVLAAAAELVRLVLIAAGIILGLALAAGTAFVAYRMRQGRAIGPAGVSHSPVTSLPRRGQFVTAECDSGCPAIEAPRPEVHLHFHVVGAEDVAEILRRAQGGPPPV